MSSYQLSERFDVHALLFWTVAVPVYWAAVAIDKTCQALRTLLPHLLFALVILAKALGLLSIVAAVVAAVACIPVTFWLGLGITGALAYVGYPRSAVRK